MLKQLLDETINRYDIDNSRRCKRKNHKKF